jgi:hypothetical protein
LEQPKENTAENKRERSETGWKAEVAKEKQNQLIMNV